MVDKLLELGQVEFLSSITPKPGSNQMINEYARAMNEKLRIASGGGSPGRRRMRYKKSRKSRRKKSRVKR